MSLPYAVGGFVLFLVLGVYVGVVWTLHILFPAPRRLPNGESTNVWQRIAYVVDRLFDHVEAETSGPADDDKLFWAAHDRHDRNEGTMTVAELITALSTLDSGATVIQSEDAEGNGYSPTVEDLGVGFYRPYNTYSGEFLTPLDDADRASATYSDDDEYEPQDGDVKAVCLWPTN